MNHIVCLPEERQRHLRCSRGTRNFQFQALSLYIVTVTVLHKVKDATSYLRSSEKYSLASSISRENSGSNQLQTLVDAAIFAIDTAKWNRSIDPVNCLKEGLS